MRERTAEERATWFARLSATIAAVGLLYMGVSIGVMYHLVQESDQSCQTRAQAVNAARAYLIVADENFTEQDKALLDQTFPPIVC